MKQTSTERVKEYRANQLLQGRSKREAYLTDEEWVKVKSYIKSLKGEEL